jgi:hypothetical protein
MTDDPWAGAPRLDPQEADDDPLVSIVRAAARLVLKHPVAAQAAFSALIAEGRQFAQTAEGQRWKVALAKSALVRHGRIVWEGSALNVLEDSGDTVIPSAILDALVRALSSPDLHASIPRLLHPQDSDDDPQLS